jgi:uncharacterized protein with GYD domain
MPLYLFQGAYTAESLSAQIKNPADRLAVVAAQIAPSGVKFVTGGFSFGDYDVVVVIDAPDDVTMAAAAAAFGAGGALKAAKTTKLISGAEWVEALTRAGTLMYRPAGS